MREIKFRSWDGDTMHYNGDHASCSYCGSGSGYNSDYEVMQFTGLHDKNGVEIYEGDIVEFSDKWEWYRHSYAPKFWFRTGEDLEKVKAEYEAEPMERRVVSIPKDYEWLLSSEVKTWWEVIGNIHQNPELLEVNP